MRFDCGITSEGVPGPLRSTSEDELLILVHTPGMPFEWLEAILRFNRREVMAKIDPAKWNDLGNSNAETLVDGDGWRMLRNMARVRGNYSGAVPLAAQLELQVRRRDAETAAMLGVREGKVFRWRTNQVFDPMTGVRLIAARGVTVNPRVTRAL